jgi:RimJ/RimL family protein N-acetyltransferase
VEIEAFEIAFDGVASFRGRPGNRPLVLHARADSGHASLAALWRRLGVELAQAGLARFVERRFTPHVTLLYDDRLVEAQPIEPIVWRVDEFVLVHSFLGAGRHEAIGHWPLAAEIPATSRLAFRALAEGDAALYGRIYTDADLMRHVGPPLTAAAAQRSFRLALADAAGTRRPGWWVVHERASGAAIGLAGMRREHDSVRLGAMLFADWQGRRCGTEAIAALVRHAFADPAVKRIVCEQRPGNDRARGLMRVLGFRGEPGGALGIRWELRRDHRPDGA